MDELNEAVLAKLDEIASGKWLVRTWDEKQVRQVFEGEQVAETPSYLIHVSTTGYRSIGWRWATAEEEAKLGAGQGLPSAPLAEAHERKASEGCFIREESGGYSGKAYKLIQPMGAATEHVGTARYPADARLWAAAPDLLDALEAVLPRVRPCDPLNIEHDPEITTARAAIAKAKGA